MRLTGAVVVAATMIIGVGAAVAAKSAKKKPVVAAKCDKAYASAFTVTRGGGKVQLRALKLPSQAPGPAVFEVPYQMCKDLGTGWRVAVGSFGAAFLKELEASDSSALKGALAACPVTFRRVDTVCAPCVAGSQHCPCADRDISDWIFCEKQ